MLIGDGPSWISEHPPGRGISSIAQPRPIDCPHAHRSSFAGTKFRCRSLSEFPQLALAVIAGKCEIHYSFEMKHCAFRRWVTFCALMAMVFGLVMQGGIAGATGWTSSIAITGAMPDDCNGCGGNNGMVQGICYAVCGIVVAVLPSTAPLQVATDEQPNIVAVHFGPGRNETPDPYPPRLSILS